MALILFSAGAFTLAGEGSQRERSAEEERAELDALRQDILAAAHASTAAEKKELPQEEGEREPAYRPGGIIIGFEGDVQVLEGLLARVAAGVDDYIEGLDMAMLTVPTDVPLDEAINAIKGLPGVRWAEPDYLRQSFLTPNDPFVTDPTYPQWYLTNINAYNAWDVTTGNAGTIVAVLDSGIRPTHEEFAGKVMAGYNTYTGSAVTSDSSGHGSMVAGVAAAKTNNLLGVAGIDWLAQIMPVKVDNGTIPVSNSVQGIKYAADHGADILNMSYGGNTYSQAEREAVDYAREKGCVLVGARGNKGNDVPFYPACCPNVIGVGYTGKTDLRDPDSSYGYGLDVVAPGVDIVGPSNTADNGYAVGEGSSFAAPLVSGEAGLILDHHAGIDPTELEWRIEEGAQGSGTWSDQMGFGIVDMDAALTMSGSGYQDTMEPNNVENQAQDLDTGAYQSYVSCNSDIDIYRIQPDMSGYSSFGLANIPAGCDYDLWLYEGEVNDDPTGGTLVAYSINSGNAPEFIQYTVQTGETYYLVVDSYGGYSTQDAYDLLVLNPYISDYWFFAEGYTGSGFNEWICVQNPGDTAANVQVAYMFEDSQDFREYPVAPHSRYTINVNNEVGEGRNVSTELYSSEPVVAERPMYFDYKGKWQGGHDVVGATLPFNRWYFAEGYTGAGFEEWLCLQNPNDFAIDAVVTYMYQGGGTDVMTYGLAPLSRFTVNVNDAVGPDKNVSIMVESGDQLVAERPMYFDYKGMYRGGHNVVGVNIPSYSWFFAEGCTRPGFEEWLCLQNPGSDPAAVDIFYLTSGGDVYDDAITIPAYSRGTVFVNESLGTDFDVSVAIFSDAPIIAERPMYFLYKGAWDGGHDSPGCTMPSGNWYFAEGCTRQGFDTWLCLQNPGDVAAAVSVDYMLGTGQTVEHTYNVAPFSRHTVNVAGDIGFDQDVAIHVESNQLIVAERPMYFDYQGSWRGGHDAMGYIPGQ